MLANLIEALEKSKELRSVWEDFTDVILVEKLKETYMNTLNGGFSSHPEDIFCISYTAGTCSQDFEDPE